VSFFSPLAIYHAQSTATAVTGKAADGKGQCTGRCLGDACCQVIPIFFNLADLEAAAKTTAVGNGIDNLPFFSYVDGTQLGVYSEQTTTLQKDGVPFGCVGNGAYTFPGSASPEAPLPGQISVQFSCDFTNSGSNMISGGSGAYGCATGFDDFVFGTIEGGISVFALLVCNDLCPTAEE